MNSINNEDNLIFDNPVQVFSDTLVELAEKDERIVLISTDSHKGGGVKFKDKFPNRFFEFGICEQNAASVSAGLAWAGMKPFWSALSTFVTMRCFEQIRDDIVRPHLDVVICGRGSGLSYSTQGPTHVSIDEMGILRTLPKMTVIAPADGLDYRNTIINSVKLGGPVYFRQDKSLTQRVNPENYKFEIGKGVVLREGSDITLIGCGVMVYTSLKVAEILEKFKIKAGVINMHTIKPIDEDLIINSAKKTGLIATLEEHTVFNGLGSAVSDVLSQNYPVKIIKFGFNDEWPTNGRNREEVMDYHGLSAKKIAEKLKDSFLKRA